MSLLIVPLSTPRLKLEPIVEAHSQELFELFGDPALHIYVPFEPPTLDQQKERCSRWATGKSPDGKAIWLNWAGREKESGTIMSHFQIGIRSNIATAGYLVARPYQQKGYTTEGLSAIVEFLRESQSVKELRILSDTRNTASHRVAKRLGLSLIDTIRNADFFKGATSDEYVFSRNLK